MHKTIDNIEPIKLAVPVIADRGLDSVVSGHFGKAPGFMTIMSDGSDAGYLDSRSSRQPSECAPIFKLSKAGVKLVLARSMGRGALSRCHEAGIKIYQTQAGSLRDLLHEIASGALVDFPDSALCSHGSEHRGHNQEEGNDE